MKINDSGWFRKLILVCLYLLGSLGILATGGGGGGGDGDDEIVIGALYDFQIGDPLGGNLIGIEQASGFSLTVEPNLQGQLICDQVAETCDVQFVYLDSRIDIIDLSNPQFVGNILVTVEDDWLYNQFVSSDRPVAGRFSVDKAGEPLIVVEFTECDANSPGREVQVTFDPMGLNEDVTCYQWDVFEDLFENANDNVELLASFAWEVAEFIVLEQALNALEIFPLIVDNVFAAGNPLVENCEIYLGMMGDFTFFWDDIVGDNQPGSGDSFRQTFNQCWFGDGTEGTQFEGVIDYVGYTQVIDFKNLLTRIGFESVTFGDGVDPLVITETINSNPEPAISLTGSYLIVFQY